MGTCKHEDESSFSPFFYDVRIITLGKLWLFFLSGDQLDPQFFYTIHLFHSSTCFDQTRAHHQEVSCVNTI